MLIINTKLQFTFLISLISRGKSSGAGSGATDSGGPSSELSASSSATSLNSRGRRSTGSSSVCLSKPSSSSSLTESRAEAAGISPANVKKKNPKATSNSSIDLGSDLGAGIPPQDQAAASQRRLRLRKQPGAEFDPGPASKSKSSKRSEKRALGQGGGSSERESSKLRKRFSSSQYKSSCGSRFERKKQRDPVQATRKSNALYFITWRFLAVYIKGLCEWWHDTCSCTLVTLVYLRNDFDIFPPVALGCCNYATILRGKVWCHILNGDFTGC